MRVVRSLGLLRVFFQNILRDLRYERFYMVGLKVVYVHGKLFVTVFSAKTETKNVVILTLLIIVQRLGRY